MNFEHKASFFRWIDSTLQNCKLWGESVSADRERSKTWREERLKTLLNEYKPEDLFNSDEPEFLISSCQTALYFSNPTAFTEANVARPESLPWQHAKMTSSGKFPLFIIDKSKKPLCFQGLSTTPANYRSANAWMTADIFEDWVGVLDHKMFVKGTKILLLGDNCTAHPEIQSCETGVFAAELHVNFTANWSEDNQMFEVKLSPYPSQ